MKNFFLICCLLIPVTAFSQTVTQDLIGLGMPSEQAEYLASILPAGAENCLCAGAS